MYRAFVIVPAVLALVLGVVGGVVIARTPAPATARENAEIRLRANEGLTTDLTRVRAIDAANPTSSFGFPMDDAERAELRARDRVGQYANTVDAVVNSDSRYAGLWLVQAGTGSIDVGWTAPVSAATTEAVREAVPSWVPVHFVPETYTDAQLVALQNRVAARTGIVDGKFWVYSTGVDPIRNAVIVTVGTEANQERAYRLFGHAGLVVELGQPAKADAG